MENPTRGVITPEISLELRDWIKAYQLDCGFTHFYEAAEKVLECGRLYITNGNRALAEAVVEEGESAANQ
jgi:hypothetical protein